MPQNQNAEFDSGVMDLIERSPSGSIPLTPSYSDALNRLLKSQQVYPHADHRDGYVTARSLSAKPSFHASNLFDFSEGKIDSDSLEPNNSIFDRYLGSLSPAVREKAVGFRSRLGPRPIHHRPKVGTVLAHDPVHTLFLLPGSGPQPGLPGNYLHGALSEHHDDKHPLPWCLQVGDAGNDVAIMDFESLEQTMSQLKDLLESAPFHLTELEALGFRIL